MTSQVASATRTRGWRFRRINGQKYYSIDVDSTIGFEALLDEFLEKVTAVTPLNIWSRDNPWRRTARRCLFAANPPCLANHSEERSVRNCDLRVSDSTRLDLYEPVQLEPAPQLGVVVACLPFTDRRTNEQFIECVVLGLLPWFVVARWLKPSSSVALDDLILNREAHTTTAERKALARCMVPRLRIVPFDESDPNAAPISDDQFVSFLLRWHVARKGRLPVSFFSLVTAEGSGGAGGGGGGGGYNQNEELDAQLFDTTVRYFTEASASEALFGNRNLLQALANLWLVNGVPKETRGWMTRQLAGALKYAVDRHVVERGEAARLLLCRETVLPFMNWLSDSAFDFRLDAAGDGRVSLRFFAMAGGSACLDQSDFLRDCQQFITFDDGRLSMSLTTACTMFVNCVAKTLQSLDEHCETPEAKAQCTGARWLVDSTVLPMRGGDTYKNVRTTRYDDYPQSGIVMRNLGHAAARAQSSTSPVPEALRVYNLPIESGLGELEAAAARQQQLMHSSASIPLRGSRSRMAVSSEALHDVCSNVALDDIEDTGYLVARNPALALFENYALPMCARPLAGVLATTSDQRLKYKQRQFLYYFLSSLRLPDLDDEAIEEFMLANSGEKRAEHAAEHRQLRKSSAKFVASRVQQMVAEGTREELAKERASCLGSCSSAKTGESCPYAKANTDPARLRALLVENNRLVALDPAAIDRIVAVAAAQNAAPGRAERACMQEFVETRRRLDIRIEPLAEPETMLTHPRHYVYASAEHAHRMAN